MLWMFLCFALLIFCLIYSRNSLTYWKKKNCAFRKPIPFFGNIFKVILRQENLGCVIKEIYKKLNDDIECFGIYVFHSPVLIIKSKEMIKNILIENPLTFPNKVGYFNEKVHPLSANLLFLMKNDTWRNLRKKMTPLFSSSKMKAMHLLLKKISNQLAELLNTVDSQEIDMRDLTEKYSVDVISTCAYGINSESLKNDKSDIKVQADKIIDQKGFQRSFSAFSYFFFPLLVDLFKLSFLDRGASQFFTDLFRQSREERKKKNIRRNDFIDFLEDIREEKQPKLSETSDIQLEAQAVIFFVAGAESTRTMMTMCFYQLALKPLIQDRLRREILQNLDVNGFIEYEILSNLEYLDLVIKETLRMYPFVDFLQRHTEKNHIFPNGLKIEKGTHVLIPISAIHHDPRYYPNPDEFIPERFLADRVSTLQYVYLPFGGGQRRCIGERFAMMSMKTGIAMFLKDFEVVPGEQTEIPMKLSKTAFFLTPAQGSVYLKIRKISS